jgi:hypothetical protein
VTHVSTNHARNRSGLRRILVSGWTPVIIGALLLLGLAAWVMPVPNERIVFDARGNADTVTVWDTSRWQAVAAFWWQALLLAGALATVLFLGWSGRSWLVAKASTAPFFAASLFVHGLLVLSLGTVPIARAVIEQAEIIRVSQAAQFFDEPQQARAGSRPAYEKVADLRAEDTVKPHLIREAAAASAQVAEDAAPLVPTLPMHTVRNLPPQRLLFVPPRVEVVRRPMEIARRSGSTLQPVELELDMPELPPPEAAPRENPLKARRFNQARQEPVVPSAGAPESLRLPELKRPRPVELRPELATSVSPEQKMDSALPKRRQPIRLALAEPPEPKAQLKAESSPADGPPAGRRGTLPRLSPPALPKRMSDEPTKGQLPLKQPTRIDVPSPKPLDAKPSEPRMDRLPRATVRADRIAEIEDKAAAQAPLVMRQKEERQRSVALYGGTKASEAAVERGLDWLAAHQNANGSWGLHNFHVNCKHAKCSDPGTVTSDPAGTGIALLPFLGAGHTPEAGKHKQTVARALHWLVAQQQPNGTWLAREDARPMYGHAMASIALCEAYGMTRNAKLREPAQKALDYIVKAQHAASGGWRYKPNQAADTSVVGWQLMALKSGEMAGLSVPVKTFAGIKRWLASVESNRPVGGLFGYQSAQPTPAMTAQGLLCLQYLGVRRDDPRMRAGTDYLLKHLPRVGVDTTYYWYHANQVMYHMQGKHWKTWNDRLRDLLVTTQESKGALAGSWKPEDAREKPGGRVYATALRVLMLEVYYRHLPLYQQLEK